MYTVRVLRCSESTDRRVREGRRLSRIVDIDGDGAERTFKNPGACLQREAVVHKIPAYGLSTHPPTIHLLLHGSNWSQLCWKESLIAQRSNTQEQGLRAVSRETRGTPPCSLSIVHNVPHTTSIQRCSPGKSHLVCLGCENASISCRGYRPPTCEECYRNKKVNRRSKLVGSHLFSEFPSFCYRNVCMTVKGAVEHAPIMGACVWLVIDFPPNQKSRSGTDHTMGDIQSVMEPSPCSWLLLGIDAPSL